MKSLEEKMQIQVSNYLRLQYPNVIFTFDASGLRLPMGLAVKAKSMRSGRGIPDMMIFEPVITSSGIVKHGLFIELKVIRDSVFKKNGDIRETKHIQEQLAIIQALNRRGYLAIFAFGFNDAKKIIDDYLSNCY